MSQRSSSPASTLGGPTHTPSRRNACEICRKRKVRCSGERPSCDRCRRSKRRCVYLSTLTSREYIESLENKIRQLEHSRSSLPPAETSISPSLTTEPPPTLPAAPLNFTPFEGPHENAPTGITLSDDGQLVARFPIFGHVLGHIERETHPSIPSDLVVASSDMIPPISIVNDLLDHFRASVARWYPIFHVPTLLLQVDAVCRHRRAVTRKDASIVMLVLAVAMTSLPQASHMYPEWKFKANVHYRYAQDLIPPPSDSLGYVRLQIALIDLLFILYNPNMGSIWDMTRSVTAVAIDLGLYQEHDEPTGASPLDIDLQRRAFWITYSFETAVCLVLGRPSSIPDSWLSVQFPSILDDSSISHEGMIDGEPSPLKMAAVQRFRLRLIQSEIHDHLYTPKAKSPDPQWVQSVVRRVDQWRQSLPSSMGLAGNELSITQYHLTLLMLFRPSPGDRSPDETRIQAALKSAAEVMRCQRNLYRTGEITFNWFTVQQLFSAGVSYINCIWQAHHHFAHIVPRHVEALIDVQGWTSVMEAVTALTPGTRGIRPAMRAISESIVKLLTETHPPDDQTTVPVTELASTMGTLHDTGFPADLFDDDSMLGTLWAETFARSSVHSWQL